MTRSHTAATLLTCAWVLWKHSAMIAIQPVPALGLQPGGVLYFWEIKSADEARRTCDKISERLTRLQLEQARKTQKESQSKGLEYEVTSAPGLVITNDGRLTIRDEFICLPDTIDPRDKQPIQ